LTQDQLRPLGSGPQRRTYLLSEGVFVAEGSSRRTAPRRRESLPAYVQTLVGTSAVRAALHPDVLGQTGPLLQHAQELQFCLVELVPYLRSLAGRPPLDTGGVSGLGERARQIQDALGQLLRPEPYAEELAETLGAPCAILARAVMPLEPVGRKRKGDFHVDLDGRTYRYCLEHTRALPDFLRGAGGALRAHVREVVLSDDALKQMLKDFRAASRATLRRYKPSKRDGYAVFHQDDEHQLQYAGGAWLLVRRSLTIRTTDGTITVALRIRGRTRRERLSVAPSICLPGKSFWCAPGVLTRSRICMGLERQYKLLLSNRFTEAEAVVQWLDAGAILATGRPEFHRRWRGGKESA
jgi:hypothetical protein